MNNYWVRFRRNLVFAGILIGIGQSAIAQSQNSISLIPRPAHLTLQKGNFILNQNTSMVFSAEDIAHKDLIQQFALRIAKSTGFQLSVTSKNPSKSSIRFKLNRIPVDSIGNEGYLLQVAPKQILIQANQPKGWFYAMETLMQLLPSAIESQQVVSAKRWSIPCVYIIDYPQLAWRGLMLDVSRHFFPKEVIKSYINQMAKYKLNTFHWHLTDNQGWRAEIKSLPELTRVGAWRVSRTGYWKGFSAPESGEAATDGGFYSQDDIKEIVDYAAARFVTVLPEVDVPGHSLALIASYPNLSCTKMPQLVLAGDPWNIKRTNVLCVGNDSTYLFLDKVFTELATIFPSEYIHIGGDEVIRDYWRACSVCQKRMKDEGLKSEEELQTYFLNRLAKIVQSKGKKVMAWYDKLEGKMDTAIALISWKDMKGGIASSAKGHQVVMAPAAHTYLDFYQNDPVLENGPFTVLRLTNAYSWNPLPQDANRKKILGGEACLWTEQVANERKLQYMTWPRAIALSEVFWSKNEARNWNSFIERLEGNLSRLDSAKVKYSTAFYEPMIKAVKNGDSLKVDISTEVKGLDIYYTFDDTDPDNFYPKYQGQALEIPKGAHHIRAVSYKNGKQLGRVINLLLSDLSKRIKAN